MVKLGVPNLLKMVAFGLPGLSWISCCDRNVDLMNLLKTWNAWNMMVSWPRVSGSHLCIADVGAWPHFICGCYGTSVPTGWVVSWKLVVFVSKGAEKGGFAVLMYPPSKIKMVQWKMDPSNTPFPKKSWRWMNWKHSRPSISLNHFNNGGISRYEGPALCAKLVLLSDP